MVSGVTAGPSEGAISSGNGALAIAKANDAAKEANTGRKTQNHGGRRKSRQPPQVRKVNDFIVYMDEVLGEGQYGKVCKA